MTKLGAPRMSTTTRKHEVPWVLKATYEWELSSYLRLTSKFCAFSGGPDEYVYGMRLHMAPYILWHKKSNFIVKKLICQR